MGWGVMDGEEGGQRAKAGGKTEGFCEVRDERQSSRGMRSLKVPCHTHHRSDIRITVVTQDQGSRHGTGEL